MTQTVERAHQHVHAPGSVPGGWYAVPAYSAPGYAVPSHTGRFNLFIDRLYLRAPRWAAPLAVLVCFFGGVTYTLAMNPTAAGAFDSPSCIVKLTTGFDCPGCGGTRAFWYLLHGDLAAAARSHLIAVFLAPYLAYMFVAWSLDAVFRVKIPTFRVTPRMISIFLIAWGVFTVARNLPWAPFTWLYV